MRTDDPAMLMEPSIRHSTWEQALGMHVEVVRPHIGYISLRPWVHVVCGGSGTRLGSDVNLCCKTDNEDGSCEGGIIIIIFIILIIKIIIDTVQAYKYMTQTHDMHKTSC